jgi:hypothetical protein
MPNVSDSIRASVTAGLSKLVDEVPPSPLERGRPDCPANTLDEHGRATRSPG